MKVFLNRAPLCANSKALLSSGKIRPEGWLRNQLIASAKGFLSALGNDKAAEATLESKALKLSALTAYGWTLGEGKIQQRAALLAEGLLSQLSSDECMEEVFSKDYASLICALRALYLYFTASSDKRVLAFADKFFRFEHRTLSAEPSLSGGFNCSWVGDNIYLAIKLYNLTEQKYLIELCNKLKQQSIDWTSVFYSFPTVQPMGRTLPWSRMSEGLSGEAEWKGDQRSFHQSAYHQAHGVNVARGLKYPGAVCAFKSGFKEQGGFKSAWEKLSRFHMPANGMFTCDELLNGAAPHQASESRAVAETLLSMETLLDLGDYGEELFDRLEKLAYNCLPAMTDASEDFCQQAQQANQIFCSDKGHDYYNLPSDANTFKSANLLAVADAWPRFAASLWLATYDEGLYAVSYAPCSISHTIDGVPVRLRVKGDYPFGDTVEISVQVKTPVEFPLYLRVPFWAQSPLISLPGGEMMAVRAGETTCVRLKWEGTSTISLSLPAQPRITRWTRQSAAVEVGPVLMALSVNGEASKTEQGLSYSPTGKWAYALDISAPMKLSRTESFERFKHGQAPLRVHAMLKSIDEWSENGCDTGTIPVIGAGNQSGESAMELVPYAWSPLRICQFPAIKSE